MSEAMLPRCARCVLVVCSERGRSEGADARGEHGANYGTIDGLPSVDADCPLRNLRRNAIAELAGLALGISRC